MLSPEVLNRLPSIVFWAVLTVSVVTFVLTRLAEGKGAASQLLGPLGRRIQRRADARKEQWQREIREAVDAPDYKALQRRITTLEKLTHKLEAEIKKLELVEEIQAAHQDMDAEYLRKDAQWHVTAGMMAAEEHFELPPRTSYTQFVREYREKNRE